MNKRIKRLREKTLEEQVETFRFAILNPDQDNKTFLEQSGYFLYKHLIMPAEPFLSKKSRLVILPDGTLHYIPFEVLITSKTGPGDDKPYAPGLSPRGSINQIWSMIKPQAGRNPCFAENVARKFQTTQSFVQDVVRH